MAENTLTLVSPQASAIAVSEEWEKKFDLIRSTVAPGLSNDEFALFVHVARVRHLDPLQRQIHAVKRSTWNPEKNSYEDKMTLQTGIDGYRAIANRTGLYMPSDRLPLVEDVGKPDMRVTVWVKKFHTLSGQWMEFGAIAYYREFVQTRKDKQSGKYEPNSMWSKMPVNQLTKCAEALVLRKGWPEELGQLYVDEELPMVETPEPPQAQGPSKTQRDVGTLKPSTEPNRGHGNEGMKKSDDEICSECRVKNGHTDKCPHNPTKKGRGKKKEESVQTDAPRKTGAQRWAEYPGHNPEIHITFAQGVELFNLQKELGFTDEVVKEMLLRDYEIEHRPLIEKDVYEQVLQSMRAMTPKQDETEITDDDIGF